MSSVTICMASTEREGIFKRIEGKKEAEWGALPVEWVEVKNDQAQSINHLYQFTVNRKTGDLFIDCRKAKIWCKMLTYVIVEPLVLTGKTICHLLGVSLALNIYQEVQKIKTEEEKGEKIPLKNKAIRYLVLIGENVIDTVKTPFYGAALVIIGLTSLVIGPFAPTTFLFKMRETVSKVELSLNRGEKKSIWIVYRCFQPLKNIDELKTWGGDWGIENTQYPENVTGTEKGLINLAAVQVHFRREHRAIFNDCFRLLPDNVRYVSPSARK